MLSREDVPLELFKLGLASTPKATAFRIANLTNLGDGVDGLLRRQILRP